MKSRMPIFSILVVIITALSLSSLVEGAVLYLHDDVAPEHSNAMLMDLQGPSKLSPSMSNLNDGPLRWYTAPFEEDTRLFGDASITLFIEAYFLRSDLLPLQFRVIRIFLLDVSPAGVEIAIGSTAATPIFFVTNNTIKDKEFTINNIEHTIPLGHTLGIRVEKSVDLLSLFPFSVLQPFFSTDILFDSTTATSILEAPFDAATGELELETYPQEQSVKPGEEAIYEIAVRNHGTIRDNVTITHNAPTSWNVTIDPAILEVPEGFLNYCEVYVAPPPDAEPGTYLNFTITAQGQVGIAEIWLNTTVAELTYGITVHGGAGQAGQPGDILSYSFVIDNTGDLADTYTLSLTSGWNASLSTDNVSLEPGEQQAVTVSITIPQDAANNSKSTLTLTAQSQTSTSRDSSSVITTAIVTADNGGDTNSFWDSTSATFFFFVLFIAGIGILVVLAALLTYYAKKYVDVGCGEQMKEIAPGYAAEYTIMLTNPLEPSEKGKHRLNYQLALGGELPDTWVADLDRELVTLGGGESTEVTLRVVAPMHASLDEWASIDIIIKPVKIRGKTEKVNVATLLREPRVHLKVDDVTHEPATFKEGDRIVSTITLTNVGEATTDSASVLLFVNGREKNRVEKLTVSLQGYAKVAMPWVAEPGENRIEIKALQE